MEIEKLAEEVAAVAVSNAEASVEDAARPVEEKADEPAEAEKEKEKEHVEGRDSEVRRDTEVAREQGWETRTSSGEY